MSQHAPRHAASESAGTICPGCHALPMSVPTRSVRGSARNSDAKQCGEVEAVGDGEGVIGGVAVVDGVPVDVALTVAVCDAVPVLVGVAVTVDDAVVVAVAVIDAVCVVVALPVLLPVDDGEAVVLAVREDVGVEDGVMSDAKLRPRYTGTFTLPSAASQAPSADSLMAPVQPLDGMSWLTLESNTQGTRVTGMSAAGSVPEDTTGELEKTLQ